MNRSRDTVREYIAEQKGLLGIYIIMQSFLPIEIFLKYTEKFSGESEIAVKICNFFIASHSPDGSPKQHTSPTEP